MRYVFYQHDHLVEVKNRALAHLKAQLDQEQGRAAHAEAESKNQRANLQRAVEEY
jgi:molecular chaperone GrpE (heat shock protein)